MRIRSKQTERLLRGGVLLGLAALLNLSPLISQGRPAAVGGAAANGVRRVNVWPTAGDEIDDNTAPIFWFGRATEHDNYVDVRLGYTEEVLYVFITVVDYYLWEVPDYLWGQEDPRHYDAVGLYLDTAGDRASTPQPDDYFFANGWRNWPNSNDPRWHRQGRGTGSGWDQSWSAPWTERVAANWYNSGPNNNSDRDAGWATVIEIPFASLGLIGPPAPGTVWGVGLYLYDRDEPKPATLVPPAFWPETFVATAPSSWGQLAFAPPPYQPHPAAPQGTTVVRRGLGDSSVADAYVGGGGNCEGGIFGGSDRNYGSEGLFVASQSLIADFPCWSKSYLRFGLNAIPPGKVIISATLTLHLWGNAGPVPSQSQPSLIQLSTVMEDWNELDPGGITWNNAPLAAQNLSATWVYPRTDSGPDFPGVPYEWDATQAVAEAYVAGQPLNVVLYTADTNFDSSKYFLSSEAGDWVEEGRPTLTVVWGEAVPGAEKRASRSSARTDEVITYTIRLLGADTTLHVDDSIPVGMAYMDGSVTGGASFEPTTGRIVWSGTLTTAQVSTITFATRITTTEASAIVNTATITDGIHAPLMVSALTIVNGYTVYLPVILKFR